MLKSAIVGCGSIAGVHAKVLAGLEDARLCALADIVPERARAMAEQYGAAAYASLGEMLANEQVDVLHILTPHHLHVPMAIEALSRGIHVFLEKPAAISREQFAILTRAAQESAACVGVCFQNRYNPPVQYAREMLKSGQAGRVLGARAFVTWSRGEKYYTDSGWRGQKATEGGGALINQSIHTMDLLAYLLGRPLSVEASMHNRHLPGVIDVEDTLEAYIRFPGAAALFYATTAYCLDAPVMLEIACESAVLRIGDREVAIRLPDGTSRVERMESMPMLGKEYWGGSHKLCIDDFYRSLKTGEPFALSLADVAPTMELVFGCYASAAGAGAVSFT